MFPAGARNFSLLQNCSTLALQPTQPPTQWVRGVPYLKVNGPKYYADHSPTTRIQVWNGWTSTSTPSVWLHGNDRQNIYHFCILHPIFLKLSLLLTSDKIKISRNILCWVHWMETPQSLNHLCNTLSSETLDWSMSLPSFSPHHFYSTWRYHAVSVLLFPCPAELELAVQPVKHSQQLLKDPCHQNWNSKNT